MSGHFGDLMAPTATSSGLTTAAAAAPAELLRFFAIGKIARDCKRQFAAHIEVRVAYNVETETPGVFHRQVTLHLDGSADPFCTATSKVSVNNDDMLLAIGSNKIGIGQLFRHFDTLPVFTLLAVRRGVCQNPTELVYNEKSTGTGTATLPPLTEIETGGSGGDPFWRLYQLEAAAGISCVILEQFQG
eukprot:gene27365-1948_t